MAYGLNQIVVDGDSLVYTAAYSAIAAAKQGDTVPSESLAIKILKEMFHKQLDDIGRFFKKNDEEGHLNLGSTKLSLEVYLTSTNKSNYRYTIAKTAPYKSNRGEKPLHYDLLRNYLIDRYNAIVVDGMEADDAMGIEASKDPENALILAEDKDMLQVECWHYWNTNKNKFPKKPFYVSHPGIYYLERTNSGTLQLYSTGLYKLFEQLLRGDSSDTIPSPFKGFGDLKVYNFFKESASLEDLKQKVMAEFIATYQDSYQERFQEQYDLVKILTSEEEYAQIKNKISL